MSRLPSLVVLCFYGRNTPSGNLQPSKQDITLTIKLKEAGMLMDIKMMDRLIISPLEGQYYSFADNGLL